MKVVKNTSMQGHYVTFNTPNGVVQKFIGPKKSLNVPDNWGGKVVDNFIRRRILKVKVLPESPIPKSTPNIKTTKKRVN